MIACRCCCTPGDAGAGAHLVAREVDRCGERKDLVVAFRRDHGAVVLSPLHPSAKATIATIGRRLP